MEYVYMYMYVMYMYIMYMYMHMHMYMYILVYIFEIAACLRPHKWQKLTPPRPEMNPNKIMIE